MNNNLNISFMAFSTGRSYTPVSERRLYVGTENIYIDKINPTLKELQEMFPNRDNIQEPVYVTEVASRTNPDKMVKQVAIDFYYHTDEGNGILVQGHKRHFITCEPWYSSGKDKYQVIDKYGRTAWANEEQINNHIIPISSSGNPLNIDKDFRKAFRGEPELTEFIKKYLRVPDVQTWDNDTRTWIPNPRVKAEDCEARFDANDIMDMFKGKFDVLRETIAIQPMNTVKVLFCVRNATDGRQYQDILINPVADCNSKSLKAFNDYIEEQLRNSRMTNYEFFNSGEVGVSTIHEYKITPTEFTPSAEPAMSDPASDLPF